MLSNVMAISCGGWNNLALRNGGTVIAWGDSRDGMNEVPRGLSNVVSIAVGNAHCAAVQQDGRVVAWGEKAIVARVIAGTSNLLVETIVPGPFYSDYAITKDGRVAEIYTQGLQIGDSLVTNVVHGETFIVNPLLDYQFIEGLSNVVSIAVGTWFTGARHTLALKRDGTVFGWGNDLGGNVTGVETTNNVNRGPVVVNGEMLSNVVAIAATSTCSFALKKDGTVVEWGFSPYHSLEPPAGLSNVVAIAAGNDFCLAITTNAAVAEKFRHQ